MGFKTPDASADGFDEHGIYTADGIKKLRWTSAEHTHLDYIDHNVEGTAYLVTDVAAMPGLQAWDAIVAAGLVPLIEEFAGVRLTLEEGED